MGKTAIQWAPIQHDGKISNQEGMSNISAVLSPSQSLQFPREGVDLQEWVSSNYHQQQKIINSLSQEMGATPVAKNILQNTADLLTAVVSDSNCIIWDGHWQAETRQFWVSPETIAKEILLDFCSQAADYYYSLLLQGKPLAFNQLQQHLPLPLKDLAQKCSVEDLLLVSLFYGEFYQGVIFLYHSQHACQWTELEISIVSKIASNCALTMGQTCINEKIAAEKRQEQLLNQLANSLNSSLEPENICQDLVRFVGEYFRVDRAIVFRLDRDSITMEQEWLLNDTIPSLENEQISLTKDLQLFDLEFHRYKQYLENGAIQDCYSTFSLPIEMKGELFGGLTLQFLSGTRTFTSAEIETLERIGQQGAIALHNAKIYQSITQELQERSKEAQNSQTEYFAYLTHELRTPLTAILGFARMLLDQLYGELNPRQMQYVQAIADCGEHLLELINDLLDLTKIEAHREELYLEKVAVEDICLASISMVQQRATDRGLKLNLVIEPSLDFCMVDQRRVKQILVNLLSNAIKFTEVGSVTLEVKPQSEGIDFAVIDTGIGISKSEQKQLFQPFIQLNSHLHRQHKGTGLGLVISRKLAQLHGGDITLTSEQGQGSCFTFHLLKN